MARCNCSGRTCACVIEEGDGATVTGSGTPTDPYVISAEGGGGGASGWAPGDLKMSAGYLAPAGWLECDGSAVSRSSYPDLFDAVNITWGAGNGSSTFNLPDFRGRFPMGAGGGYIMGGNGGAKQVVIAAFNLPAHTHSIDHNHASFNTDNGGAHKHKLQTTPLGKDEAASNINAVSRGTSGGSDTSAPVESTGVHNHAVNVPPYTGLSGPGPGMGAALPILPPYRVVRYFIKT